MVEHRTCNAGVASSNPADGTKNYPGMSTISFNYLQSLFPEHQWDLGVLSADALKRASLYPIKSKFHAIGVDYTNTIHFPVLTNTLILVRDGASWDYTHYDEAVSILKKNNVKNWFMLYTNFKEAGILAGLGVRARNSLLYNYKFGFDSHIAAIGFLDEIVDLPTNKRVNRKMWTRCNGCDDCAKACPVGAIHNEEEPNWLDSTACDAFIGVSDHPSIPSIKTFWRKHVYPDATDEQVAELLKDGSFPWDRNGYTFDGNVVRKDGVVVEVPVCRECTSQPRCSKWNGKYPYESVKKPTEQIITFHRSVSDYA